jgi:hypothetical protein
MQYDDGAIVSLLRQVLVRSMAEVAGLTTDGRKEIWKLTPDKKVVEEDKTYQMFSSVQIFLRRIGGIQYSMSSPNCSCDLPFSPSVVSDEPDVNSKRQPIPRANLAAGRGSRHRLGLTK